MNVLSDFWFYDDSGCAERIDDNLEFIEQLSVYPT